MKRILVSLSIIAAVAAIVVGGTIAFFSDVEKSTGNTFTAGIIDIELDDRDEPFGFDRCILFTTPGTCDPEPNCKWDSTTGVCKEIAPDSVTKTFVLPDWKPSHVWNQMISIHNKGENPIDQLMFWASSIDDSDDGLKPESEPDTPEGQGGGDLMSDDIEIFFVEQWLFPTGVWEGNTGGVRVHFLAWAEQNAFGENPSVAEVQQGIAQGLARAEAAELTVMLRTATSTASEVKFVDLTENFRRVFDATSTGGVGLGCGNNDGDVTLNELAKGKKDILVPGETLDKSEVKILIPHFHFMGRADNDLQGDVVKFDLTVEGFQVGADLQESCITPNIIP